VCLGQVYCFFQMFGSFYESDEGWDFPKFKFIESIVFIDSMLYVWYRDIHSARCFKSRKSRIRIKGGASLLFYDDGDFKCVFRSLGTLDYKCAFSNLRYVSACSVEVLVSINKPLVPENVDVGAKIDRVSCGIFDERYLT